jgi:hypothetical protein
MTRAEGLRLWEEIKAKHDRWDACVGPHDLEDLTPEKNLRGRYRCRRCGGECDASQKHAYEQGLRHGRGLVTPDPIGQTGGSP